MRASEIIKPILREYRRDITAKNIGQRILARGEGADLDEILAHIESADPTPNLQYSEWLARRYIAGDFLLKDLSVVRDYLTKFIESRKLIANKDINAYTLKSLKELLQDIYKTDDQDKTKTTSLYPILPDTKVLYNGAEGQLVIPLTIKSSQELQRVGKITKWCTADSRAPTHFPRYARSGPMYVWIDKNGDKYQFHFPSRQYMNKDDKRLSPEQVKKMLFVHPVLSRYMPKLVTDLTLIPQEKLTPELCLAVVQQDGGALADLPLKLRTPEICLAAVQQSGRALAVVPLKLRTPELCLAAVQQNGYALSDVPMKLRTPELCLAAVQGDGESLADVPMKLRTPELCLAAVQQAGRALAHVPRESLTSEICLAAVQQWGLAVYFVPLELRTLEICLAAVQQTKEALRYVPSKLKRLIKQKLNI